MVTNNGYTGKLTSVYWDNGAKHVIYDGTAYADADAPLTPVERNEVDSINPPVVSLGQVKADKLAELEYARDAAESLPVTVQGKVFSASPKIADRFEKMASRLRRGKPTALTAIYQADGSPVSPVTAQLLEAIEDAIASQGEAAWNRYGAKVGEVLAAATVAQVDAVVW